MVLRSTFITCLLTLSTFHSARAATPSPKAESNLICHTNHASECYPQIFQPTEKFQTVHDDQNLPPGLHVRMNLATGVKEARLNIPEPDGDVDFSSLTIIDDSDLVGYQKPPEEAEASAFNFQQEESRRQPFLPPQHDVAESTLFTDSASDIKVHASSNDKDILPALSNLEDLSHSYHWGLSLAKDSQLIHKLFQLLLPSNLSLEVRSLATLVFGTAIHNNQAALTVALSHFYNDEWPEGPLEAVIMALLHEQSPLLLNRMMFLLSSLCQDQTQLQAFLDAGGVELLMKTFNAEPMAVEDRDRLQKKVTHFVLDHLMPTAETNSQANDTDSFQEGSDPDAEWTMIQLRQLAERYPSRQKDKS
ncbi:MAG: hypothetical protein L6R38_008704 [Xanthoria sp. 2 TBL-2021]|nr:MAG: hypothetical protein L6R38_008704 [Xanthoria sp. 2 TBL-2021]